MRLILASASPRRAELLHAAGYEFEIAAVAVDESHEPGETPARYVRRLAAAKSAAAARIVGTAKAAPHVETREQTPRDTSAYVGHRFSGAEPPIVLGADTVVVVDSTILGKPTDDADAARMLHLLSAKHHQVLTGVSVRQGAHEIGRVETTTLQFAQLTNDEIAWYVASGEGRDKAGAYAIQGLASRFIPRIEGSYSNVVGLPIACVRELITEISNTRQGRSSPNR